MNVGELVQALLHQKQENDVVICVGEEFLDIEDVGSTICTSYPKTYIEAG